MKKAAMQTYVALLRAVNVGGTGKLLMADLQALCVEAGFGRVETYIASGNVVFDAELPPQAVQQQLQARLAAHAGRPIGVLIRTVRQMTAVLAGNPFAAADPRRTYVIFLDRKPPADALDQATGRTDEQCRLGEREIYVAYPTGMGRSKLVIPAAKSGTARNLNTVAALTARAAARRATAPG